MLHGRTSRISSENNKKVGRKKMKNQFRNSISTQREKI